MAGTGSIATNKEVARFGNEAASAGIVEDSAREVPTGPDPLHHNNHPIGH
nr:CLE13 protein [Glycine max]